MADTKTKQTWARILENVLQPDHRARRQCLEAVQKCRRGQQVLDQLGQVGWHRVEDLKSDLTLASFKCPDSTDPSLKILLPENFKSEPPQVLSGAPGLKNTSLKDLHDLHLEAVDLHRPVRKALEDLEQKCRVLDAPPPDLAPWQQYRTLAVSPGVCLTVTLDPGDPQGLPELTFLGSDRRVNPLRQALALNVNRYDADLGMADNLERLLEVKLPGPEASEAMTGEETFSVECGICYSYKLGNALPTEVCDNDRCSQPYHVECLYECLRSAPSTAKSFNTLFGKCPYCEEDISCIKPKSS